MLDTEKGSVKLSRKQVIAWNMIPRRKTKEGAHYIANVTFKKGIERPEGASEILNWIDGKRDLLQILKVVEQELDRKLKDDEIDTLVRYLVLLAKYGYLAIRYKVELYKKKIKTALKRIGLKRGDLVFVHSSLSSFGYIKGGSDTVIDALLETIGKKGTLAFITHCAKFTTLHNGIKKNEGKIEAYNPKITPSGVGKISDTFWRRKGVLRSLHPTHSVADFGPLAEDLISGHTISSSPCGKE